MKIWHDLSKQVIYLAIVLDPEVKKKILSVGNTAKHLEDHRMPFSQIFRDPPLVLWPLKIKVLIPILDAFPFFFSHLNHSLVFTKLKQINLVRNSLTFIFG